MKLKTVKDFSGFGGGFILRAGGLEDGPDLLHFGGLFGGINQGRRGEEAGGIGLAWR